MNPNSLFAFPRLVPLFGIVAIFPSAEAASITQSMAFPVTNQAVTLTVSEDLLTTPISVSGPLGSSQLTPDAQGQVVWTPVRYGKYTLTCGDATNAVWVTARPMKFHWWSCTQAQKNVTEVMQANASWEARGVSQVQWTGGEAYSRGVDGHNWTTANEWFNGWTYAYTADGMALDEIFCDDVAPTGTILDAVGLVRQAKGPDYSINVWVAGYGPNFTGGAAKLRASKATVLIEDYYGTWNLHKSRWDAVRAYGLQNQAISGIWPGTTNLTNEAEIRTDVALVRLAAPEANGIAIFAPATNLLEASDRAIEDYYLKPLIHLSVNASSQLVVWNLGNEDAAGFSLQLLNGAGAVLQTVDLSGLVANGKQTLAIPTGAMNAKVINPPNTANLYAGNSQYSNGIYPLLVPGRYTWTNANGDHLWSTFSSWYPNGPPPGNIDSGNYAYFDGSVSAPLAVTAPSGETSVNNLQFISAGWTISGNATTQNFYTYGVQSSGVGTNTINIGMSARDVVPASFTVGQDNTLVMNGLIGAARNNGALIKNGPGTLTVTYPNTYTGGTAINAGTLAISGAGSIATSPVIDIAPAATLQGGTFGSGQTVKGTGKLAGLLTIGSGASLSPAGDTASGTLEITGTLVLGGTVRMQFQKSGNVLSGDRFTGAGSVTCGGTLLVTATGDPLVFGDSIQLFAHAGGFNNNSNFTTVSLPVLPSGLTWDTTNLTTSGTITVGNTLGKPSFSPAGGTYYGAQSVTITADVGSTIYYTLDGNDPTDASPHAASPISGVNVPVDATTTLKAFARKSAMTDSPVAGATYVTLSIARWNAAANGNWSDSSKWLPQLVPNGSGAIVDFYSFPQSANATVTLDGNRTVGAITFGNASPIAWTMNATGGSILTLAAAATPAITVNDSITATIAAPVAGTQGLSKSGPGTLILTSANTYSSGTSITAGTLQIGGAGTLGNGAYNGNISNNGALVIASTTNQALSGVISGTGSLTQAGSGTLTLSGLNTYTGATTVNAGTLTLNYAGGWSAQTPGTNGFTVNTGATLNLNNNLGTTWDGFGKGITVNGGTVSLGGSNSVVFYSGGSINMTGGTLNVGSNWNFYGFGITTHASGTMATCSGGNTASYPYNYSFNVERGAAATDLRVTTKLEGARTLTKNGNGKLELTGANTYTGATSLDNGTLLVNGSLGNTAIAVAATGTLGGTGTAVGTVTAAGTISPGTTGTGTLSTGAATLNGKYSCQLNGAAADRWNVSGNLNLTGSILAVSEISPATFTSTVIAKYTGTLTGTFTVSPALPAGVAVQYDAGTKEIRLVSDYNSLLTSYALTPGTNTALTGDSDGDGLTNLQEYAFGLSLTDGSSVNPITAPLDPANATFTYTRRKPSLTGLTYKVWTSSDLTDWTEDTGAQQTATDQGANQSVQVTLSAPAPLSASKLYIRCSAE